MKKTFFTFWMMLAFLSPLLVSCDNEGDDLGSGNNAHEYVDLGLPSGLKWATCNVGATTPEEYGNYYCWGEIEIEMGDYDWSAYSWSYDAYNTMTKYNTNELFGFKGFVDGKNVLDAEDDVAAVLWGGNWRMPTKLEVQELIDNCTIAFAYICGTRGFKLTSKINGKYIFLPEAGHDSTGFETWHGIGWRHCVYWSSTSKDLYYYTYEDVGVSLSIYQDWSVGNWDKERQEYDNRSVGRIIKLEGGSRRYASAVRPVSD